MIPDHPDPDIEDIADDLEGIIVLQLLLACYVQPKPTFCVIMTHVCIILTLHTLSVH